MPRRFANNTNRTNLDRLTARWRARHDLRREGDPFRPRANPGREALARRGFPYRDVTPADYVAEHGAGMTGFTYDDESYADADLDAWIVEVGALLREHREGGPKPKPTAEATPEPSTAEPKSAAQPKPAAKSRAKPKSKPKPDG
ncbi:MAG TPA: hypothetical protein VIH33_00330 [Candidatus Limnocylindria bacterium]|jgi:hypothetical protein